MIVRLWWPLQSWLSRRPLVAALAGVVAIVLLATAAWLRAPSEIAALPAALGQRQALVAGCFAALLLRLAKRTGPWLGALAVIAIGIAAALALAPDLPPIQLQLVAVIGALLVVPLLAALADARGDEGFRHAVGRGTAFAAIAGQFAVAGVIPLGWHLAAATAAMVVAVALLPSALASRRRAGTTDARLEWLASEPPSRPPIPPLVALPMLIAGLALLAWRGSPLGDEDATTALSVAGVVVLLWGVTRGNIADALSATVACISGAGWSTLAEAPIPGTTLAAVLALAQAPALLAMMSRDALGGWQPLLPLSLATVLVIGFAGSAATLAPVLAFATTGFLALTSLTRRTRPLRAAATPEARLAAAGGALAGLEPWWRHYGGAKLRLDPVYRQLAEAAAPWGRTLDLGCGPGLCAALAAARGDISAYVGIDLDRDKLLAARRLLGDAGDDLGGVWRLAEARLPLSIAQVTELAGPFDTVLLIDVLHYWPVAAQRTVLEQVQGLLAPGGRLYLRDGVADAGGDAGKVGRGERLTTFFSLNHGGSGLHFVDEKAIREMLTTAGFSVEACVASGEGNRLWHCQADPTQVAKAG